MSIPLVYCPEQRDIVDQSVSRSGGGCSPPTPRKEGRKKVAAVARARGQAKRKTQSWIREKEGRRTTDSVACEQQVHDLFMKTAGLRSSLFVLPSRPIIDFFLRR